MELTKTQRSLLEVLSDAGDPLSDMEISQRGINRSDIIRESLFFQERKMVAVKVEKYFEVKQTDLGLSYGKHLPEYTLLQSLKGNPEQELGQLEKVLNKKNLGMALSELRKRGILEMSRLDPDLPITVTYRQVGKEVEIEARQEMYALAQSQDSFLDVDVDKGALLDLQQRKVIRIKEKSSYEIAILPEGSEYLSNHPLVVEVTRLTPEIIRDWEGITFKEYDPALESKKVAEGRLHPLRQLARKVETIFRDMGYECMAGDLVADSFHNFDALFTPQDHPAREMQDTFFLEHPQYCGELDEALVKKVRDTHEGSFKYKWDYKMSRRNILRTHTTAVTAEYLQNRNDVPLKLFSIGKVFRNEKMDAMHLPEFHQIEGVVVGDVNLRDLMGHISTFYEKLGLTDIEFKKTFNPYTEPSMEIFAYNPAIKRSIEIGNSGMFRPEMLEQFGYGNQRAIAWGLALERLASIMYNQPKIKDLYGTGVDIDWLRGEKIKWL